MNEHVHAVPHRETTSPIMSEAPIALSDLVARIEVEHAAVGQALGAALAHAIAAGEMLIVAKRQVQHGEWRPWLEANCSVPARTARHYMALARRRKRLCDQNGNVLPISVHAAIRQMKELGGTPMSLPYDPLEMEEFPSMGRQYVPLTEAEIQERREAETPRMVARAGLGRFRRQAGGRHRAWPVDQSASAAPCRQGGARGQDARLDRPSTARDGRDIGQVR